MKLETDTIRGWALGAVAVTSTAVVAASAWLIYLLSTPDWCGRAIGAAQKADARPEYAVGGCFTLLNSQISALSINSYITLGTLALCLAVLVIIVLAGGHVSLKGGKDGVDLDVGKQAAQIVAAAQVVADAGQAKAEDVKAAVTEENQA
jgi:hypothetical protein